MPVHPPAEGVAQDWPGGAVVDGPIDGSGHRGWQRDEHDLADFAAHAQYPVAVLLAQVGDAGPQASKIRRPSRPRRATRAKSFGLVDSRAVVISASNCR
ncbi:hypothetical protein [Micromonospora sp. NPDC007230]|uniref:hypothetical protein n=1 Tax=Micromonospora sp. NPDC007230 TaxID=3364237 RepID=UPI0036AEDD50